MMGRLPTSGRPWLLSLGAEAVRFFGAAICVFSGRASKARPLAE